MNPILFVVIFVVAFVAIYLVFRKIHPQLGTIGANLSGVAMISLSYLGDLLGQAQLIPWHDLVDEGRAKLVMLSVLIGNAIIRTLRKDPPAVSPPSA